MRLNDNTKKILAILLVTAGAIFLMALESIVDMLLKWAM